jgi:hypothetical protein
MASSWYDVPISQRTYHRAALTLRKRTRRYRAHVASHPGAASNHVVAAPPNMAKNLRRPLQLAM